MKIGTKKGLMVDTMTLVFPDRRICERGFH